MEDDIFETGEAVVNWVRDNYPTVGDHLDRDTHIKDADDPYTLASDEPLEWKTSGKLVRLNVAKQALNLFLARAYFRSINHLVIQRVDKWQRQVEEIAAIFGIGLATREVIGRVAKVIVVLLEIWEAEKMQRETEGAIRRASLRTQRELKDAFMGAGKKQRRKKTAWVWTRHEHGAQRAPNKSWQSQQNRS